MKDFGWHERPDLTTEMISLWKSGTTATDIASKLGHGLTKNMIMGKLNRMSALRDNKRPKPEPKKIIPVKKVPDAAKAGKATVVKSKSKPVPDYKGPILPPETFAEKGQCNHMTGDPREPGWVMCGNEVMEGRGYCCYHWLICTDHAGTARVNR